MSFLFDGPNKRILVIGTSPISAQDLYSRWKDWMLLATNSAFAPAFRSVAGDPIGSGNSIAPYFFLNTLDGWRIRPDEADHELRINGNLYSEDPNLSLFAPTVGDYAVTVVIERSSAAIAVASGSGLSTEQAAQLRELFLLAGLDPTRPLAVTSTSRRVPADGSEISQTIAEGSGTVTVTRT